MSERPADLHISPIVAVTDLERARAFYEGRLGLDGTPTPGGWVLSGDHGTRLVLLADIPDAGSASWPVATFEVTDVHAVVRELRSRGVRFLGPDDVPFELDEDGVSNGQDGITVAWLRDPDGSILTVYSTESDDRDHLSA